MGVKKEECLRVLRNMRHLLSAFMLQFIFCCGDSRKVKNDGFQLKNGGGPLT